MTHHPARLFHIGPQKCATTWVYRCLKDHPAVMTPPKDSIHFFDMHYMRGRSWYDSQFKDSKAHNKTCYFDPTYSYIRNPQAAKRIASHYPDAKFIVGLRHPVDRAFSHYWHERKKGTVTYPFRAVFDNYDLFDNWVSPGLYAQNLTPYVDLFGAGNILPVQVTDIQNNPQQVWQAICRHANIPADYTPGCLHRTVNPSGPKQTLWHRGLYKIGSSLVRGNLYQSPFWKRICGIENMQDHIDIDTYAALMDIFIPDINRLEDMFDIDLSCWKGTMGK